LEEKPLQEIVVEKQLDLADTIKLDEETQREIISNIVIWKQEDK